MRTPCLHVPFEQRAAGAFDGQITTRENHPIAVAHGDARLAEGTVVVPEQRRLAFDLLTFERG